MKALQSIPQGFVHSEPWPAHPRVEVRSARSNDVLVPIGAAGARCWALNPYSGCEFACVGCRARSQVPFRDADPRLFERDIHVRANAVEAVTRILKDGVLERSPLVLGTSCDPWQPAEQKTQATRAVLDVLARWGSVDLRAQTRSTLIPRDSDLLAAIARRGRVSVSFSIPTLDLRLSRLLEPLAPSPDRRLVSLETLARAGIRVGIIVAPVLHGISDSPQMLERLLRRARDAGASYATALPLSMAPAARARIVGFVSHFDPELATRYDMLLSRGVESDQGFAGRLEGSFAEICHRLALHHAPPTGSPRRSPQPDPGSAPRQLSLF
ncbi:MAG: hypothetical protein HY901_24730 [Deltaproteobacteria bacterium]|nr:hypothetical protein [Deltaproteobacteria bacterium]